MPWSPNAGRAVVALLAAATLAACTEPTPLANTNAIETYITGVTARDGTAQATLQPGAPPAPTTGPTTDVVGISSVVNGGSTQVTLQGSDTYQRVLVGVLGAEGYYDLLLPTGSTLEDVVLNMATGLQGGTLRVRYAVEGPSGLGPWSEQNVRVIRVGTGDVQISVAWTGASDVDLHVFDPTGEHIYYGDRQSASGGQLDLDSNPACNLDNKNNENIVWPTGAAPAGEYRVEVAYFDDCGVEKSDWVVTVLMKGQAPRTFSGRFSGVNTSNPSVPLGPFTYVP
jgi:hypothetical protein